MTLDTFLGQPISTLLTKELATLQAWHYAMEKQHIHTVTMHKKSNEGLLLVLLWMSYVRADE